MHFWLFKNGIANVLTFTPFMGVCLDEIQVVNIPSWASINVNNAIFLEKWHGCAIFADPLWLIATIEYVALVKKS